ncbi:Flagellar biogenesis protein FliO [Sphingomonas antarctica]|uniref:flagellar biosynthetic protein FliO n=1 Tax=Sphingomonas antarctica TaxID=2040274 RepID=UPI0039E8FF41
MTEYIIRLLIMVPLIGAIAWGSLWLWKKTQGGMMMSLSKQERAVKIVDAIPMAQGTKLAVVEFAGRTLLVSASRNGITLIAEGNGDFADA